MNNTNSTEELLKTVDLTLDDVRKVIKEGVNGRYKAFRQLREITTREDLEQDILLYYLSIMESTGDIRLNHYIKKYQDKAHVINLIKQTAYQMPIYQLRSPRLKLKTISLSTVVKDMGSDHLVTLEDCIPDNMAEKTIYENISNQELNDLLREELTRINVERLRMRYNQLIIKYDEYNLPFLLDTENYKKAYERTLVQLQIIRDLLDGYPKKSLAKKYASYREDIRIIKQAFLGRITPYLRTSC